VIKLKIPVNVKKLVDYESVSQHEDSLYELEDFELGGEPVTFRAPVHAVFDLTRVKSGILLNGTLETQVELTCVKCLKRFTTEIKAELNEAYSLPGYEEIFEGYDEVFTIENGQEIDIEPAMVENIVINISSHPVCSELCQGICPKCGADLNTEKCSCERDEIDPRLSILKKFKESL
jgi:uncharacterized protein